MGKAYCQYGVLGERDKRVVRENKKQCKRLSLWRGGVVGDARLGILRLRFPHRHPYTYRHII